MNKSSAQIIICNYNGEKYLDACLTSLRKTTYPNFKVLFIDDGSTDKSLNMFESLAGKDKRFELIKNINNLGLTKSRNKAIKLSSADILVFLDNDTEVTPRWLSELVRTLTSFEGIGAAQSKLVDFKNRNKLQHAGIKLIPYTGWGAPISQGKSPDSYQISEEIIGLGASLAVKREIAEKIGGFDEKLIHYTDDLDFSWRIWIAGYRIVSCPMSIVYHWSKGESSIRVRGGKRSAVYFHLCKNSLRSITKNYQINNAIKYVFTSIVINLSRAFLVLIKRKDTSALSGTLKGIGWYLINIGDTLLERKKVQKTRIFTDRKIIKSAMVDDSIIKVYRKYFKQTKLLNF